MPKLTIFQTDATDEKLLSLIVDLEEAPGYGFGTEVKEDKEIPRKYVLTIHNGHQDLERQIIRFVEHKIISGKASDVLENKLRTKKIPYLRFDNVELSYPDNKDLAELTKDLNLITEKCKPQVTYTP